MWLKFTGCDRGSFSGGLLPFLPVCCRDRTERVLAVRTTSYGHLWCMGNWGRWRILLIDFVQDFNNREMIRHDQVYPTGVT